MEWNNNWFGSPFYKILYQNRDELEAQEFVENLINYLQPPPGSKMLDIACGSGRFAKQLAEHSYDVTGIDISNESITIAKTIESENLRFFVQDMRLPFYINYFDYAFNFFTSFGYFTNNHDHQLAARSFGAALKPNGILVIDYLNFEYVLANLVAKELVERDGYTFKINRQIENNHISKYISITDTDNNTCQFQENVAAFSLSDFNKMFKAANLSLICAFGDYQLNPYHSLDSPRLIMLFKKKYA